MNRLSKFLKIFLVLLMLGLPLATPLVTTATEGEENQNDEDFGSFYDDDLDDYFDGDDWLDDDYLDDDFDFGDDFDLDPLDFIATVATDEEAHPAIEGYVPEMLFAEEMLSYVEEEAEIFLPIEPRSVPTAHSGLVQFVLEPVNWNTNWGTLAQARAAAFNANTVVHLLFPTATGASNVGGINGRYGRDAMYLGQSANGNRFRIMIAGFEGYVDRVGQQHTITASVNGVNRTFAVRANAVFVPFNNYPNNSGSTTVRSISHYVNRNGELFRYLTNNVTGTGGFVRFLTGPAPSWMTQNTRYYSFDGVYFYRNPRNIRANGSGAVNANNPFFNYFQYLSMRSNSTVTAAQLNNFLTNQSLHGINTSNSVMRNQGSTFINAQNRYGVNALLMYAKAMHESAGGTSSIARNNNNLFGQGAVDSNPSGNAWHFATPAASINDHANGWMSRGYLWPEDWRYAGPHVGHKGSGMNVRYATDPYWGQKIAGWAFRIDRTRPASSRDINREQIAIRRNTSSVTVTNAGGTTLYTTNRHQFRYFPFLVTGTGTNNRLRILTDPAIVNGVPNRTALFNRNNAVGFIPNSNVWLTGAGNPATQAPGTTPATPPVNNNNITQPTNSVSAQTAVVTASSLNFRRGPDTNHESIRFLPNGTTVTVLGANANGTWAYIRESGQYGWVSSEFLNLPAIISPTTTQATAHTRLAVTTLNAPFRFGPGTRYASMRNIAVHTNVEITGRHGNWRRVMVNNRVGWIHADRLTYRTRLGRITQNTALRSSAQATGAVVRNLSNHDNVMILGVSHDRNWRRVRVGDQTGWISTPHITTRNDSGHTALSGWLRPGPGANSGQIRYVNRNTDLTILGQSGNWTQVRIGNQTGWIATGRIATN